MPAAIPLLVGYAVTFVSAYAWAGVVAAAIAAPVYGDKSHPKARKVALAAGQSQKVTSP